MAGEGARVLLLHGGPGLSYGYLDGLAEDLGQGWEVAAFQQRGLPPSATNGPFSVHDHVADVRAFLDELGWDRALVLGHSWGGHLALHAATVLVDRLDGVLAVDALGAVGDGGAQAFGAEILARTPADVAACAQELDERLMRDEGTEDDAIESLRLLWPAYFPTWSSAPPFPADTAFSMSCYAETWSSLQEHLPQLESALPGIRVPVGLIAGGASPMPLSAAHATAALIPKAWVEVIDRAGHFVWLDVPGRVAPLLRRLVG